MQHLRFLFLPVVAAGHGSMHCARYDACSPPSPATKLPAGVRRPCGGGDAALPASIRRHSARAGLAGAVSGRRPCAGCRAPRRAGPDLLPYWPSQLLSCPLPRRAEGRAGPRGVGRQIRGHGGHRTPRAGRGGGTRRGQPRIPLSTVAPLAATWPGCTATPPPRGGEER